MIQIFPSLLAADTLHMTEDILSVENGSAGLHFDIGDGDFVPTRMLDPSLLRDIHTSLPIDLHLMVWRPSEYSDLLDHPSVHACAIHLECHEDIHEWIQGIHARGKKAGIAIMIDTPADHLDPYLLEIDYVIIMSVRGGRSGDPFHPEVKSKIREIHHKRPELIIVMDGGMSTETLPLCVIEGATGAVVGSALFGHKNRHEYIRQLHLL